jgi:hypothetical protein
MLAAASAAAISTSAHAHYRHHRVPYHACVVANSNTWLRRCHGCGERVRKGRAFRVGRQHGEHWEVWNLEMHGRMRFWTLSPAPEAYCDAAGI